MNTYAVPGPDRIPGTLTSPAGRPVAAELRSAVVEQVMRSCDDDLAVLTFLDLHVSSPHAAGALGRLMSDYPTVRLVAGCPLMALVTGAPVDPHWRDAYPPRPDSLFGHLEFLLSLYGPEAAETAVTPYEALELLRLRAQDDLGGS